MTTKDVLKLRTPDLEKMSTRELKEVTQILVSAVNKRSKRIAEAGIVSPTINKKITGDVGALDTSDMGKQIDYFATSKPYNIKSTKSISGKEVNYLTLTTKVPVDKLIDVFNSAQDILTRDTGSLKGTRTFYREFERRTRKSQSGKGINLYDLTPEQVSDFFKLVERNKELHPHTSKDDSLQKMRDILKVVRSNPNADYEELEEKYLGQGGLHEQLYKQQQDKFWEVNPFDGVII